MIIAETHNGQLRLQGNETITDAKDADAAKFRVGSRRVPGQSGGGGAYSWDIITEVSEGNHRTEAAVLVGGFNGKGGEVGLCLWDGTEPITDASQKKVVEFRHNEIEFKVPVKGLPAGGSSNGRIHHEGGQFVTIYQNDGNVVTYKTNGTTDESKWTAHRVF